MNELTCCALLVLVACAGNAVPSTATDRSSGSVQDACRLVSQRCSRCHTLDRVLQARVDAPQWPDYIHRMRLMPGSGIPPSEEEILVRCLVYRSPTETGLVLLGREEGR